MAQKHLNPIQNREQVIYSAEANFTELYNAIQHAGTTVYVNGVVVTSLSFTSDPQTQLNNKLNSDGDASSTTVAFTEADTRTNIATGETLATLFGKIKKFFTDLKTVAFSGSYNDLSDKPTIPTVNNGVLTIKVNGTSVATFSANQSGNASADISIPTKTSDLTNDGNGTSAFATESFVNSSIATNTAYFRGTYNIVTDLGLTTSASEAQIAAAIASQMTAQSITPTNNDYVFVAYPDATDPTQYEKYDRYKYDSVASEWQYEYTLNNSSFTAAQWGAINSGITSGDVTQITTNKNDIAGIKNGANINSFGAVETALQGYLPLSGGAITGLVDATAGTLKIKAIQALTGSSTSATTYGLGTSGQVLKSNGSNVYWATDTSNNNAYYLQSYYFTPNAGAEAIYRYKLIALDKDNRAVPITITDQSNTTMVEKTPTSVAFKPWKIFQYNATTTVAAGGALASHTLQETYNANPVYNFNTTISAKRIVYLCGTFDRTTGLFTLDTTMNESNQYRNYYVQVPTNTANITLSSYFTSGKDYILVGGNYGSNTTNLQLFVCNPMYHFDGTNLLPYDTYNASRIESAIPTVNNGTLTIQLNGSTVQTFTANQSTAATANIQALPNFSLNISHQTAGNPRQVKFLTINYNTKATYFKMSATSCHDNGTSYQFLEDIIIGCTTGGSVVCNVYKYCQASVTLDGVTRNYGDVFYVIDTTNKLVDFYILCGQYATSQFTPATKIGNTTIQYITQYTGTAVYYSTGTKVWANGNSTTYATLADIGSCYSATNPPPYPVTSVNGATGAITGLAVTNADNNFTAKQTFTAGVKISGRYVGGGDDEGLIIAPSTNNYAGVCCGTPSGRRAVFYLKPSAASANSVWRYNNGSTTYDIAHPEKSGTIALTSDIPTKKYLHKVPMTIVSNSSSNDIFYPTVSFISSQSTAYTSFSSIITNGEIFFSVFGFSQSSSNISSPIADMSKSGLSYTFTSVKSNGSLHSVNTSSVKSITIYSYTPIEL